MIYSVCNLSRGNNTTLRKHRYLVICTISDNGYSPVTLNKLAMNARRLHWNFLNLNKSVDIKDFSIQKRGQLHCDGSVYLVLRNYT